MFASCVSSVVGACAVFAGGGGAGDQFGISPALIELVRSRTSRQIPKVLRIVFSFNEIDGIEPK
jgi:hypothetical protein